MSAPDARELLPCPFCGQPPILVRDFHPDAGHGCRVRCGHCRAAHPMTAGATREYATDAAVATWNTRARLDAEPSPVEGEADGVALIAAERERQKAVEGWTLEHDDGHVDGALAQCAAVYAIPPVAREVYFPTPLGGAMPDGWPFDCCDWKPGDRIRELSKAGALIAAEIDRLARIARGGRG